MIVPLTHSRGVRSIQGYRARDSRYDTIDCLFDVRDFVVSRKPKRDAKNNAETAKSDLRGTKQAPFIVVTLPFEHTHTKTDDEKKYENNKAHEDRHIARATIAIAILPGCSRCLPSA